MNWHKFKAFATVVIGVACLVCIAVLIAIALVLTYQMLTHE